MPIRGSINGANSYVYAISSRHVQSDLGQYFVVTNPTPGTPITGTVNTTFMNVAGNQNALCIISNNASTTSTNIYLDYIKILMNGTMTNTGTTQQFAAFIDNQLSYNGGTAQLQNVVNVNMASAAPSIALVYFGNLTVLSLTSNARQVHRSNCGLGLLTNQGQIIFTFGGGSHVTGADFPTSSTIVDHFNIVGPPIILGMGQSYVLYNAGASQTAGYPAEVEIGWFEA